MSGWMDGLKGIHKSVQDVDANNKSPSYKLVLNIHILNSISKVILKLLMVYCVNRLLRTHQSTGAHGSACLCT